MKELIIEGQIVDIHQRRIYFGRISIENGRIKSIEELKEAPEQFICPGFIDAHVHIESSMLVPSEFARMAVGHGTVATVSDPHEIANVLGEEGVYYMLENASKVPLKFFFGAPSCVPATSFETAGAEIDPAGIERLLEDDRIKYLAEMMNWPGVIFGDEMVHEKLNVAKRLGKPIDGHAPGLTGEQAEKYAAAGPSTDHECFSYEEAKYKLELGVKVQIREGSAAKNYAALAPLIKEYPDKLMFCSDDKHPDDLELGHVNKLVARAVGEGYPLFDVLRMATLNIVEHYGLEVGALREGDPADFLVVKDLKEFDVLQTWIDGECVFQNGNPQFDSIAAETPNKFKCNLKTPEEFAIDHQEKAKIRVIEARDGELITGEQHLEAKIQEGRICADPDNDILKIAVVNRYEDCAPSVAFIRNFGLQKGALASCVAHDSHNIVAVACDDESLAEAVNKVIEQKGGISVFDGEECIGLPLPVAGIMSNDDAWAVAENYKVLDERVNSLGCKLRAPYMTLSFMALLVIPQLKLSDKGLFDGQSFNFVELEVD